MQADSPCRLISLFTAPVAATLLPYCYEGISVDNHNPIIDGHVEEYRKEIQRIFDEESSSKTT